MIFLFYPLFFVCNTFISFTYVLMWIPLHFKFHPNLCNLGHACCSSGASPHEPEKQMFNWRNMLESFDQLFYKNTLVIMEMLSNINSIWWREELFKEVNRKCTFLSFPILGQFSVQNFL